MKLIRLSAIIVILSIILSVFAACGADGNNDPNPSNDTTSSITTESTSEAPTTDPVDTVDPLLAEIVQHMREADKYLIFSIGDSLTEGQGASDPVRLDYTAKFTEKLAEQFPDKSVYRVDGKKSNKTIVYPSSSKHVPVQRVSGGSEITVARCGIGGNTVKRIIDRSTDFIGKTIRNQTGDLFIICSGINDAMSNDPEKYATPAMYKNNLNTLLDMIYAEHPNADVILMTPTYVHLKTNGKVLDAYSDAMKEIASERQIALIDLHKLWMDHWVEGAENYGQRDWLNSGVQDSCHPSDIGHEAIADEMIRSLFGNVK